MLLSVMVVNIHKLNMKFISEGTILMLKRIFKNLDFSLSIRDVMYSKMTVANTTVLYIGKLLRE